MTLCAKNNNYCFGETINVTGLFAVCTVRQSEQQIKSILDSIAVSEERKKELIRGDVVDKAEQLSESQCLKSFK